MPEMDGYELTAAIRAEEQGSPRTPIVALTANALKSEEEHCREVGMDDYLSKPAQLVDIKAVLEKWLPAAAEMEQAGKAGQLETLAAALPRLEAELAAVEKYLGSL